MSVLRDRKPHGLCLNVKTMWDDFERMLAETAEHLARDSRPLPRDVEARLIRQALPASLPGWRRLFEGI
jgi:hypothetical protein